VDVGEAEAADVDTEVEAELFAELLAFVEMEVPELLVIVMLFELGVEEVRTTTRLVEVGTVEVSETVAIDAEVKTTCVEVDATDVLKTLPPGASYQNIISILL
jgi:hypothetical protein